MEGYVGAFILLLILGAIAVGIESEQSKTAKARQNALQAYQGALESLKSDPSNPNLRQETLRLGRVYSNLTRNKRGVTVFDEIALMNDIGAASAGSNALPGSLNERLEKLASLRSHGLIDGNEYSSRRAKILDEI